MGRDERRLGPLLSGRIPEENMMNQVKLKWLAVLTTVFALSGCGTQMKTVMSKCDSGSSFDVYSSCIKTTYTREGTYPNAASVKAFYASLDSLAELFAEKKISSAQAKAAAYQAYVQTIQADNDRSDAAFSRAMNGLANMPQGQVQPSLLNAPVQTRCTRLGNSVNCTSY